MCLIESAFTLYATSGLGRSRINQITKFTGLIRPKQSLGAHKIELDKFRGSWFILPRCYVWRARGKEKEASRQKVNLLQQSQHRPVGEKCKKKDNEEFYEYINGLPPYILLLMAQNGDQIRHQIRGFV